MLFPSLMKNERLSSDCPVYGAFTVNKKRHDWNNCRCLIPFSLTKQ
jgi:hypothetical protein